MGPRFESVKVHQWPVGQVVKTEASHAFNIGSNPVRVTSSSLMMHLFENTRVCFLTSIIVRRSQLKPASLGFQLERNEKGLTEAQKGAIIQKLLECKAL